MQDPGRRAKGLSCHNSSALASSPAMLPPYQNQPFVLSESDSCYSGSPSWQKPGFQQPRCYCEECCYHFTVKSPVNTSYPQLPRGVKGGRSEAWERSRQGENAPRCEDHVGMPFSNGSIEAKSSSVGQFCTNGCPPLMMSDTKNVSCWRRGALDDKGVRPGEQKETFQDRERGQPRGRTNSEITTTTTTATMCRSCSKPSCQSPCVADQLCYQGPIPAPPVGHKRLHAQRPVQFLKSPLDYGRHPQAELRSWFRNKESIISQNSSKRKVSRGLWLCRSEPDTCYPAAIKYIDDLNARDGRSVKREIECHLFIYQNLDQIRELFKYPTLEDAWPSAELFGYHLNRRDPGHCVLITRRLSGPDFFDIIRQERLERQQVDLKYEYYKLHFCLLALRRMQQFAVLGIRHNDIKPDNIVLDVYTTQSGEKALDVKLIDLGTASMHSTKEFTGGTSWYESPEQKMLEFYSKKQHNPEKAKRLKIGLESDVWAAGLSIAEVLVGKRVVDFMKAPHGPGALEYLGSELKWSLDPEIWIRLARKALFSQSSSREFNYYYCVEAAMYIFDHLVKFEAAERGTLQDAINKILQYIKFITETFNRKHR